MVRELGDELRRRREDLGLTLNDAQGVTKIRLRYLEALESGNFETIPGEVYTKGFLRAYAEYLGLDGTAMVERYKSERQPAEADQPDREHPAFRLREARYERRRPRGRLRWWAALGRAAVLIGLVVFIYYASRYWWSTDRAEGGPVTEVVDAGEQPALKPAPPEGADGDPLGGADDGPPGGADSAAAGTEARPEPAIAKTVAGSTITYSVSNVPELRVKASFAGPCWIRVSVDGRNVFEGILGADQVKEWSAGRDVRVRAGFPANMRLEINGMATEPFPRNDPVDLVIERQV